MKPSTMISNIFLNKICKKNQCFINLSKILRFNIILVATNTVFVSDHKSMFFNIIDHLTPNYGGEI